VQSSPARCTKPVARRVKHSVPWLARPVLARAPGPSRIGIPGEAGMEITLHSTRGGRGCLGSVHARHALNAELLDDIVTPPTVNDDFKILGVVYKSLSFRLAINTLLIVIFFY
jgi:hypothetical protein